MIEEPGIATVYAPNVTPSESGVGGFSDEDLVRAIRHGVDPDGQALFIMPAEIFILWGEEDIGATIAYLKSLPPVDNETPNKTFGVMGGVLYGAGQFGNLVPAGYIDHDAPFVERPEIGANAEYGEYFARAFACTQCHRDDMQGGPPPENFPGAPEIPPAAHAANWSTEEFLMAVTEGVTPDGRELDPEWMDWGLYAGFDREELEAVHLWLQTLR
jgi:mono/diheme cytochrome c family protein